MFMLYDKFIHNCKNLTAKEEVDLARRIADGDSSARDEMFLCNVNLVIHVAKDYRGRGVDLEDLVQEGMIGLTRACERFNPEFGVRFGTYAPYWIKMAIRDLFVHRASLVRIPVHMIQLRRKYMRIFNKLSDEKGEPPSFDEVIEEMGLKGNEPIVSFLVDSFRKRAQLPEFFDIEDSSPHVNNDNSDILTTFFNLLKDREVEVLKKRFGIGGFDEMTLQEIGDSIGITREWTRKIEEKAINKIRKGMRIKATSPQKRRIVTPCRLRATSAVRGSDDRI